MTVIEYTIHYSRSCYYSLRDLMVNQRCTHIQNTGSLCPEDPVHLNTLTLMYTEACPQLWFKTMCNCSRSALILLTTIQHHCTPHCHPTIFSSNPLGRLSLSNYNHSRIILPVAETHCKL